MPRQSDANLLIVNADDWGYDEPTTSAIVDCHLAGGVTSTTAMAFMRGSRAAVAQKSRLPGLGVGLHLNFTEEYSDSRIPIKIRDRQRSLIEYFEKLRARRWLYDPRIRDTVNRVIADQYQYFVDLYGRQPTHIDGHHHSHFTTNVLLSPAMPAKTKIRNALSDAHRPNPITDVLRYVRARIISRRFRTTDYFFDINTVWPKLSGDPPSTKLYLARRASVEVMVHPAFPEEYEPLQSPAWVRAIRQFHTGTFEDL